MNSSHPPLVDVTTNLFRVNEALRTSYWCWTLYSPDDGPRTLLALLKDRLPHIAEDSWASRFDFGGIYINGHEATADTELPLPCRVEYYEPKFPVTDAKNLFPRFKDEYVIFSDSLIAVVYKPPGLSSMPAKEQRHFSLKASLEKHFNTTVHMPSRLDVSAQGLVVVSISPLAHAGLQHAFERRLAHKSYRFATHLKPAWTTHTANARIDRHPEHTVLRRASYDAGQVACTLLEYSHQSNSENIPCSVVTATPITGRTHQIRVHAASAGLPLLGDNFYEGSPAPYLHLVSVALSLPHPVTRAPLSFSLPASLAPSWTFPSEK